ncbi:unnamed protein product [Schistosoma mattheei]|uniref:Uncharacterized protein n=1 Tax=Schistosoma mattheei TaxID=31246 RepID=A0A3P8I4I6_9TREM|nr:unnamed protein product [Schistosoma mattheei]
MRDCEQAEDWMAIREASLAGDDVDGNKVDALIKKHEDFNRAITLQEVKIQSLMANADKLLEADHYDANAIEAKRGEVLNRWTHLKNAMIDNRSRLGDVQTLQAFIRDADEMELWINEKMQFTMDEPYKDPTTNIQAKHQKHQAFEAELAANAERLQGILAAGQRLKQKNQCMGQESAVEERIAKLANQWDNLVNRSHEKSEKLQEANRQAAYNAGIKDIEFWLGEMETSLVSPDHGRDSASVDSLLSKHQSFPDRCYYLDVVVGLAYRDEATELYWLEQPFLKVLPCQTSQLKSDKSKTNKPKVRRRSRTADCTEV